MSKPYRCSFCGKYDYEVWKLIAGVTAFICDGCVDMCTDIVRKGRGDQRDHNKEEIMSDNADLYKEIHALQAKLDSRDIDLQTLQTTLYVTLSLLDRVVSRMELQRVPPHRADLNDLRIQTLTNRVEVNETAQNYRLGLTEQQIKKDRDAILEKLDAILQRLPERPQGFDE
jgi:hypothetical protein